MVQLRRALALAALAIAGCGGAEPATEPAEPVVVRGHGLSAELPRGWHAAPTSQPPGLTDPREVLAAASYPLGAPGEQPGCAHMPSAALQAIGAGGAFVTLQERGIEPGSKWLDFPPRPAHFGPELGAASEASGCAPGAKFRDHWFGFTDGERHFHVLVAFGRDATPEVQRQAWALLDGVRVDPAVRPDWRSAG